MKAFVVLLGSLLFLPVLAQNSEFVVEFEAGFKAGYADGSWEYRDYNFNLSSKASQEFVSGYNRGYLLAKGMPALMPFEGEGYREGFEAGYADGSWEYRDYNFNLTSSNESALSGYINGYVNGYIIGHMEKVVERESAEMEEKLEAMRAESKELEKRIEELENNNADLEKRIYELENDNLSLEKRTYVLEKDNADLKKRIAELEKDK